MGRKGDGVEIRERSIRLSFVLDGKPIRRTLEVGGAPMAPTPANVKYARRLAAEIRDRIEHDTFSLAEYFPAGGDTGVLTLAGQLDTWLAAQRIEESTRAGYSSGVRFWQAALGGRPLRALKQSEVLTVIAARPDLSGKTINNYTQVLRESLALALVDKLVTENVAAGIKPAKHQKDPPDPFDKVELEKIIAAAHARHPGQAANLIEFWMWTGMRTSEVFGLRWDHVDLASGYVLVTEALVRGVHKDNTKTNQARRVKLNSRALAAMQAQRKHTQITGGAVFQDPRYGTGWVDERAFRRSFWTPVLKVLGIRYRRPYNMRHTYATQMLMAGANHSWCAKQLGHSVEMFQRTYARWIDGEQDDREMDRIEATLAGPARKEAT